MPNTLGCSFLLSAFAFIALAQSQRSGVTPVPDEHPKAGKPLYLNIIWHQHQPLYLDPATDQLQGPWVRTHGTKDYYDMVSILQQYPELHFNVNLTSSLLQQLDEYYVRRLKSFVDGKKNRVSARRYFAAFGGKTDPWIDLALKPTGDFDAKDRQHLLTNVWNAFGLSDVMIDRFPEYKALRDRFQAVGAKGLSEQELREIKFWFYLAYFDPDFLEGRVTLVTGDTVDLTDLVSRKDDGTYRLRNTVSEDDCNRIVAEAYKVLAAIIPMHRKLMYDPISHRGQVEVITTPYYHPILPLIYDSDLAKAGQPDVPLPTRFHFPMDAEAQVAKAVMFFEKQFGTWPNGMWPAEGSVAQDVVAVFAKHGIRWVATDEKILARSQPEGRPKYFPYALSGGNGMESSVAVVFRDTELSDKIGFVYQQYTGEEASDDFVQHILRYAPAEGEADRLLTVILDGENAWEHYRRDNDGKAFLRALYRKLSKLQEDGRLVTTTMTEYIHGNPGRGISPHPVEGMDKLERLWPGSWINGNYDTWIGEGEENRAWEYLLQARTDLANSGLPQPDPKARAPRRNTKAWYTYRAWESMYAAEGSDWFWWYGNDQNAPAGDKPFDAAFRTHLNNMYEFAGRAGGTIPVRTFEPVIREGTITPHQAQGTMAQSRPDLVTVQFQVDARDIPVPKAIFIAGNHELLGNWTPNKIRMYDDGTHGDEKEDGIWTIELRLPPGIDLEYKYTNSGVEGSWTPGEEFARLNRSVRISHGAGARQIVLKKFGIM